MTAGRTVISANKDWCTPPNYVEAIRECFDGEISLDPCSNQFSIVHAQVEYRRPEHDGLRESWDFPTVYVNPPYGADREADPGDFHGEQCHSDQHRGLHFPDGHVGGRA